MAVELRPNVAATSVGTGHNHEHAVASPFRCRGWERVAIEYKLVGKPCSAEFAGAKAAEAWSQPWHERPNKCQNGCEKHWQDADEPSAAVLARRRHVHTDWHTSEKP